MLSSKAADVRESLHSHCSRNRLSVPCAVGAPVVEIGMANGSSPVVIADALLKAAGGLLTSIDPHQTMPTPLEYDLAASEPSSASPRLRASDRPGV
jgi:hypothetical protein